MHPLIYMGIGFYIAMFLVMIIVQWSIVSSEPLTIRSVGFALLLALGWFIAIPIAIYEAITDKHIFP